MVVRFCSLSSWSAAGAPVPARASASPPPLPSSPSSSSSSSPPPPKTGHRCMASASAGVGRGRVRVAVVGDVHDDWILEEDSKALNFLQPDLVLFTGDYGNENVQLVRSISNLQFPKAAILGNHDCWRTHQFSEKKVDRVRLQLESLGDQHVGYKRLDFPRIKLSVVGGRPFSCGGDRLFRPKLLSKRYGIDDMAGSAMKIHDAAAGAPEKHSVILLAHNGPTGLGSRIDDICGRDWVADAGDHGDPDLERAITKLQSETRVSIPLVVFGHMHKSLAYGRGLRKMIAFGPNQTIYLNGAVVPRVKCPEASSSPVTSTGEHTMLKGPGGGSMAPTSTSRAFTVVDLFNGAVERITEVWVLVSGAMTELAEETVLYQRPREHM